MKNKKRSILVSLIATFVISVCASVGIWIHGARAQETATPTLIGGEIEEEYLLGEYFAVPSAQITCGGQTLAAKSIIIQPNGELTQSTNIRLEQGGIYTLEYRAVFDGELKSFRKEFTVETPMFSVDSKSSSAVYGVDTSEYQTGKKGVNVVLAEGDILQYNDVINLNESNGDFLEFFLLPNDGPGTMDARKLIVTLTDLHNPEIILTVVLQCCKPEGTGADKWYYDYTYMLAGGQNQTPSGFEAGTGKLHVGNEWGAPTRFSFYGMHGQNVVVGNETLSVNYNQEENAVYANGTKVIGLSDLDYFEEEWKGFTTGEVKMEIMGAEYNSTCVNMMITRIGVNNLNQKILADVTPPAITVDCEGYDASNMPAAAKGCTYPVFNATAKDEMFGVVPVQTTVYYSYASNQRYQVEVVDGVFKTDKIGEYTIEYLAFDGYKNVGKKTITVECKETSPAISIEASGTYAQAGKTGELIFPAEIVCDGGTGELKTYATVKAADGEAVLMDNGFRAETVGTYTVTLYAVDMLGKTATCDYTLEITANEKPVFLDEVRMPKYFLAGYNYTLPTLCAYDYSEGKVQIPTTIAVKDGEGERDLEGGVGSFTADKDGYATIIYKAAGKNGNSQKEYPIPVINAWAAEDTIDMTKYFYGENIAAVATDDDIRVSSTEDVEYEFISPMIAHKFKLQFAIAENNFTCVQIVLQDSENENVGFTIEIVKSDVEGESMALKINGKETRYLPEANFYNGKAFYFSYDDVNKKLENDSTLEQVIKNEDGSVFEGFPSQKLYLTVRVMGVSGNAELAWSNIGGQILSNMDMDTIKPSITISGDYASSYGYKTIGEIYSALAADVLSPETTNSLTVYDPNRQIVKDINGLELNGVPFDQSYFIELKYYGSYSIVYSSKDAAGREQEYFYALYVKDDIAPKIVLTDEVEEEVDLGDDIDIVKAVAIDNVDGELPLYVYLVDPTGIVLRVENGESYEATHRGVYEIRYMAIDSFGNLQMDVYKVTVE